MGIKDSQLQISSIYSRMHVTELFPGQDIGIGPKQNEAQRTGQDRRHNRRISHVESPGSDGRSKEHKEE